MGEMINAYTTFYLENLKARDYLGVLGVSWRILLKWILENYSVRLWDAFVFHFDQDRVQLWAFWAR
jgi:hypothetical protein